MKVIVHVDGGARGNPGPAAAACVVSSPAGEVLGEHAQLLGSVTNNVAEYGRCCWAWSARASSARARSR